MCIAAAVVGGAVVSGVAQDRAAGKAAKAQSKASDAAVAEQQRQFDAIRELLSPYVEAGTGAIGAQEALLGLSGDTAQRDAITALEDSPAFQAQVRQGEESILQNAAATGGLRGGNTQRTLAQFRPQLLADAIQRQYANLGGLSQLGQASAAGQAAAGQQLASSVSNLLTQQGQAQAGAALARGQAIGQTAGSIGGLATLKLLGAF